MFELNLIREKITFFDNRRKYIRYFRLTQLVLFLGLAGLATRFVYVVREIGENRLRHEALLERIAQAKQKHAIGALEKEWDGYLREVSQVETLYGNRTKWTRLIHELISNLPADAYVDAIRSTQTDEGGPVLRVDLVVVPKEKKGYEMVDAYIAALEKNPFFERGVQLESQERMSVGEKELEVFKLKIPLAKV